MIVLGLAGHVDHGKTALVRALTGTDTDRLPEEKARGMTTDLGFAALGLSEPGGSVSIGVVDVPGHERYIRNMAAGAWGVDLALLVVAADDGWMAQTETHVRVLAAFGVPRVLPVVTKIDAAADGRIAEVASESFNRAVAALGRAAVVPGDASSVCRVSALRDLGLDALRRTIAAEASALEARFAVDRKGKKIGGVPYLFIDRVFSKRGVGLVLCGTLRGGAVAVGDRLSVPTSGESARVRGIEILGSAAGSADARSRVALNVAGLGKGNSRGDLLVGGEPGAGGFLVGSEFLVRLEPVSRTDGRSAEPPTILRDAEVELTVGSAFRIARCYTLGKGPFARLLCREPLAVPADARAALVRHGGSELLCALRFLRSGNTDKATRKVLSAALADLGDAPVALAALAAAARLAGWIDLPADGVDEEIAAALGLSRVGSRLFDRNKLETARRVLERLAAAPGGLDRAALPSALGLPQDTAEALAEAFAGRAEAARASDLAASVVPAALLRAERLLKDAGPGGFDITLRPLPGRPNPGPAISRQEIESLCKLSLAVPIDRTIFVHAEVYKTLVEKVLRGRRVGDRFAIAEVKAATGYSRKYVLPFLNRLERDGFAERDGDDRIVTRIPDSP